MNFAASDSGSISNAMLSAWQSCAATMLIFSGTCGLIAVISPDRFKALSSLGSRWVDTSHISQWLDLRIDVDGYVLRHPRMFGFIVSISAIYLAFCCLKA
jgi:hypothetical protein